jgi:hypothetical protein
MVLIFARSRVSGGGWLRFREAFAFYLLLARRLLLVVLFFFTTILAFVRRSAASGDFGLLLPSRPEEPPYPGPHPLLAGHEASRSSGRPATRVRPAEPRLVGLVGGEAF